MNAFFSPRRFAARREVSTLILWQPFITAFSNPRKRVASSSPSICPTFVYRPSAGYAYHQQQCDPLTPGAMRCFPRAKPLRRGAHRARQARRRRAASGSARSGWTPGAMRCFASATQTTTAPGRRDALRRSSLSLHRARRRRAAGEGERRFRVLHVAAEPLGNLEELTRTRKVAASAAA